MSAREKEIHVQYYAVFREQRGVAEETLLTEAATPSELYSEISQRHGFSLPIERVRVAVNDEFCPMDQAFGERDRVVFIPPVAGG